MAIAKTIITVTVYHNTEHLTPVELMKEVNTTIENLDYAYEWETLYERDGELY